MAKQTFTTGQILTAAQMTSLQQTALGGGSTTAKTTSYTLVAADAGTVVQMNSSSATTITVNTALFAAGDTVQIQNVGSGVCTVTAGTATVSTSATLALKQYDAGSLYFNTTSAAFFFAVDAADTPLTTTGDIIYSSSGSTAARLGIGSSAQVLTVASGVPSWATPAAAAATAVGCLVYSSVNQACTSAAYKNLLFDTEIYDTDGFHDTSTNTNRITIPTGKGGKYLFTFLVNFDGNATGRREYYLYKNGVSASIMDGTVTSVGAQDTGLTFTAMDTATAGDYYNVSVWQNSGSSLNVRLGREKNFFGAVYLGA